MKMKSTENEDQKNRLSKSVFTSTYKDSTVLYCAEAAVYTKMTVVKRQIFQK